MELKDKILYGGILGIVVNIGILVFFFGLTKLADLIFMATFYLAILVTVYFTYGIAIEQKLIKEQIKTFIGDTFAKINLFGIKSPQKINQPSGNDPSDAKTDQKNKEILNRTKKLIIIVTISGFILSISLWMFINKKNKQFNLPSYFKDIVLKNLILLAFVAAIQLLFTTYVTGKYLPLSTNNAYKIIFKELLQT
jgi:hypothetical protein